MAGTRNYGKKKSEFWTATNAAIAGLSELLALLFGLPFGDDLYHGNPISKWHWFYLFVAVFFAVGGPMWPLIRKYPRIPRKIVTRISEAAVDPVHWIIVLLLLFIYGNGPIFIWNVSFSPRPYIDKSHRLIVDITPERLIGFYKGRLGIEGDRLAAPYIGKWTHVSGLVDDVSDIPFGSGLHGYRSVRLKDENDKTGISNSLLQFLDGESERVATLQKTQKITALCMISAVIIVSVSFTNCELEKAEPPLPIDSK